MKSVLKILVISFLVFTISCEGDPCKDVFCNQFFTNVENTCNEGKCRCEKENFGVLDIHVKCTNCTVNNKLSVDLLIDGSKAGSLVEIFSNDAVRLQYKDYASGTKAYKVVTGSKVHDQGQITIERCKVLEIVSTVSR